jgi:hypothetical protein
MKALSATPEEAWTGERVNLRHLGEFGCISFVHIPGEKSTKCDEKSKECIFMEYYETTQGYRLSDSNKPTDTVHARDVMFTEEKVENHNRSVMNGSHKNEMPMHLLSNEGSEVVQGQIGDSDHSESMEETDSTGEQEERGSKLQKVIIEKT